MDRRVMLVGGSLALFFSFLAGCEGGKYERLPKATEKEKDALTERYRALIEEAKGLKPGEEIKLTHHFSEPILSDTSLEDFKKKMGSFVSEAAAGKWDNVKIMGARAPGKVRLLLIELGKKSGAIPFVQSADGWKLDDIDAASGNFDKDINLKGNVPKSPASILLSVAILQDPQAGSTEKVTSALQLAKIKDEALARRFLAHEISPWPKAALLYAAWKGGAACEPFAKSFPLPADEQKDLYEDDTDSFRTLLKGLINCAVSSKSLEPTNVVYKGCHDASGGPRSEYVDPVVELANKKPEYILKAAIKAGYPYNEDPVANIVVGALHGEQKSPFWQYLNTRAVRARGELGKLARFWVEKMVERDKLEPPGSEKQQQGQPKK
ncbi:MAG: hypothetical protein GXP49_18405 [Deltaproteobacteria bacterium]|nr:hypothetical protein [Deltaproteobacteria bacterium]